MDSDSDAALVAETLAGRTAAYAVLVERHQRRLFLTLRQLTRSDRDAEEIAQDAFVRAWENLRAFDAARPFFPWLSRIALNLWRNRLRGRRPEIPLDGTDDGEGAVEPQWADTASPEPEAVATEADVRDRVWRAVDALPEDARRIVVLRHVMELSYEEIVAATGLPIGTVKSRLSRARQSLADALADLQTPRQIGPP